MANIYIDPLAALEGHLNETRARDVQREVRNVVQSYHNVADYTAADILAELLQNALDAIDQLQESGYSTHNTIDVVLDCVSNSIAVTDSGCGIPEDTAVSMLAPGRGTKDARSPGTRSRGYKGVGMTFLAYGYNKIEIMSKTVDGNGVSVSLEGGRRWVEETDDRAIATRPKALVVRNVPPRRPDGSPLAHGTTVRITLDETTRPRQLAKAVLSAEMAQAVIQRQTAVGHVDLDDFDRKAPYAVTLRYVRGAKTDLRDIDAQYAFPHTVVKDVARTTDLGIGAQTSKGMKASRTARAVWHLYTTDVLISMLSADDHVRARELFNKTQRRELERQFRGGVDPHDPSYDDAYAQAGGDRKLAIARYVDALSNEFVEERLRMGETVKALDLKAYGLFAPRNARTDMQQAWGLGARDSDLTKHGYRVSVQGLVTPILHDVGLRGEAGYRNNMWVLYDLGTHVDLDMGRKTLPTDVTDLVKLVDEAVSEDLKQRALATKAVDLSGDAKPAAAGDDPNKRAEMFSKTKERYSQYAASPNDRAGLHLLGPAVQESDVINHFVALSQIGVLGHLMCSQSFSVGTYDMLVVTTPERLDPKRLPERTRFKHPLEAGVVKVVEFKKALSEIESDLSDQTKVWSEMDIIVCWEIGTPQTLQVEETDKSTTLFPGATHTASFGQHKLPVIALKDLLLLLSGM